MTIHSGSGESYDYWIKCFETFISVNQALMSQDEDGVTNFPVHQSTDAHTSSWQRENPAENLVPYEYDWQGRVDRRWQALSGQASHPAAPAIPENRPRRAPDPRGGDVSRSPHQASRTG
eukprot:8388787-Heterocapsa_arctica.AAC.1